MADVRKYFWLKLKKDFFKRHDIRIVEAMPNGEKYVNFYLKLLLESIDHNGALRFSDEIPYNDDMLATITNTDVDIVRSAVKVFRELRMIEILDDMTIYMTEVQAMLGCETAWAEKKRVQREKRKELTEAGGGRNEDNVQTASKDCPAGVRQEIEIELEIDKEKKIFLIDNSNNKGQEKNARAHAYTREEGFKDHTCQTAQNLFLDHFCIVRKDGFSDFDKGLWGKYQELEKGYTENPAVLLDAVRGAVKNKPQHPIEYIKKSCENTISNQKGGMK